MSAALRQGIRRVANAVVGVESALLERVPASLDAVGEPVVVATHRRSGTHLTMDTLRRNFPECRPRMLPFESLHRSYLNIDRLNAGSEEPITEADALRLLNKAPRPTIKTHAGPHFAGIEARHKPFVRGLLDRGKTLHVYRDGRKVMCSLWAWMKSFDPEARVPFADFIRQTDSAGRNRPRVWAEHLLAWLDTPGVVHLRFDDLVREPERTLGELAERLDLRLEMRDPAIPPPVTSRSRAYLARLRGDLGSTNHYSQGERTPRPDEAFSAEDSALFEREAGEAMARIGMG
jgi:hypothetical protein